MNGANVPRPSSPSGSERGRARSPETRSLPTTRRRRRNKHSPVAAGNTQTSRRSSQPSQVLHGHSTKDTQSQSSKYFRQNFTNNSRNHDKSKLYTSSLNYDLCFQTNSLLFFFQSRKFFDSDK